VLLPNQIAADWLTSTVSWDIGSVNPAAAVNCTLNDVKARVVEYPVNARTMPLELLEVSVTPIRTGASAGTVNCRVFGLEGVRGTPEAVVNEGVRIMVLATVPVCNRIWFPWPAKFATVLLAGMTNGTVRPSLELLVENATAGSLPNVPDVVSVRTPSISTG